mmetsp:Transcript_10498/g.42447  ORF Transcript_10498/g.42447 Transcript_10498/m.42447 type:complete len:227 (+) Transcript_10498:549-1229(+)
MQACGGLMTAENSVTPNMPRLETEQVPPWNSCGLSLPSRARPARSRISAEIVERPLAAVLVTMGVMRPVGVATATETSMVSFGVGTPWIHDELARGTSRSASATALTTTSFTETLTPNCAWSALRNLATSPRSTRTEAYACGTVCRDSASLLAMTLRIVVAGVSVYGAPVVGTLEMSNGVSSGGPNGTVGPPGDDDTGAAVAVGTARGMGGVVVVVVVGAAAFASA